jgi:hypothetical protein
VSWILVVALIVVIQLMVLFDVIHVVNTRSSEASDKSFLSTALEVFCLGKSSHIFSFMNAYWIYFEFLWDKLNFTFCAYTRMIYEMMASLWKLKIFKWHTWTIFCLLCLHSHRYCRTKNYLFFSLCKSFLSEENQTDTL